jgi:hypothetical protein
MLPSLYLRNLPDKLPKEDLKRNLYMLFATYGVILDVVALKTPKMRGQAHIVYRDLDTSTQAMRALQGFTFFGKDMVRVTCSHGRQCLPSLVHRLREDQVGHDRQARRDVQVA